MRAERWWPMERSSLPRLGHYGWSYRSGGLVRSRRNNFQRAWRSRSGGYPLLLGIWPNVQTVWTRNADRRLGLQIGHDGPRMGYWKLAPSHRFGIPVEVDYWREQPF